MGVTVPKTGIAFVSTTYNNTIVTITDSAGNTIVWGGCGACGYKGTRKSTGFAAQELGKKVALMAKNKGVDEVHVIIKGAGNGRETTVEGLDSGGLVILSITDSTRDQFGGCRREKKRKI